MKVDITKIERHEPRNGCGIESEKVAPEKGTEVSFPNGNDAKSSNTQNTKTNQKNRSTEEMNKLEIVNNDYVINDYAKQITEGLAEATQRILAVGRLVVEAEKSLAPAELQKLKNRLIKDGVMTKPTWSKLKAIGECKVLHEKENEGKLPPTWTTIYNIASLPEGVIKSSLRSGKINPNVKANAVKALQPGNESGSSPAMVVIAEIRAPVDAGSEKVSESLVELERLVKRHGFEVAVCGKLGKESRLGGVAQNLLSSVESALDARRGGTKLSNKERKLSEDTMFQLRKHQETGKGLFVLMIGDFWWRQINIRI